jgi:hypothetical protein
MVNGMIRLIILDGKDWMKALLKYPQANAPVLGDYNA